MSDIQPWVNICARLRSWGRTVTEYRDPFGKNNGLDWNNGRGPDGHIDHHFVASLTPDDAYIRRCCDMLVDGYGETPPPIVNWFADVFGRAWLIATGPSNHSGKGDSSVLARVKADLPPAGEHPDNNDFTGNAYYSGTESQHPGDATPWPDALIDIMVDIAAAEAIEFGWTANRIINHYTHTNRKIDMSWRGGPDGDGDAEFRRRVAARMVWATTGTPTEPTTPTEPPEPPKDEIEMATKAELAAIVKANAGSSLVLFRHPNSGTGVADVSTFTWRGLKKGQIPVVAAAGIPTYKNMAPLADSAEVLSRFGKQV